MIPWEGVVSTALIVAIIAGIVFYLMRAAAAVAPAAPPAAPRWVRWTMRICLLLLVLIWSPLLFRLLAPSLHVQGPRPIKGQFLTDAARFRAVPGQITTFTVGIKAKECWIEPAIQQRQGVEPVTDIPCNVNGAAYSWDVFFTSGIVYTIHARNTYMWGIIGGPEESFQVPVFEDLRAEFGSPVDAPGQVVQNPGDPPRYALDITTAQSPQGLGKGKFLLGSRAVYAVYVPPKQQDVPVIGPATAYSDGPIQVAGRTTAPATADGRYTLDVGDGQTALVTTGDRGVWYAPIVQVARQWCDAISGQHPCTAEAMQ